MNLTLNPPTNKPTNHFSTILHSLDVCKYSLRSEYAKSYTTQMQRLCTSQKCIDSTSLPSTSATSCVSIGAGGEGLETVATEPCVLCSSMPLLTVSSRDVCVAMEPTGAAGAACAAGAVRAVNCTCKICEIV